MRLEIVVVLIGVILLVLSAIAKGLDGTKPNGSPPEGDLHCPFCRGFIAMKVIFVGQEVHCPKCGSMFNAPNHLGTPMHPWAPFVAVAVVTVVCIIGFTWAVVSV